MYFCFVCHKHFITISFVISHLKDVHFLTENKSINLRCVSNPLCQREFCSYSGLRRHVIKCMQLSSQNLDQKNNTKTLKLEHTFQVIEHSSSTILQSINQSDNNNNFEKPVEELASNLSGNLMSMGLPETKVNEILQMLLETVNTYNKSLVDFISSQEINNDKNFVLELVSIYHSLFKNQFDRINTSYKRKRNLGSDNFFVDAIPKSIGGRWNIKYDNNTTMYKDVFTQCTFQYIPIVKTIKALFENSSFKDKYFEKTHDCNLETYEDFCCSSNFASNPLFSTVPDYIQIQLFYDDFEVVNPLGSKTTIHKIGAIYLTIRNIPFEYNSQLENIYLVALFFVNDLKNENINFNTILRPIVEDIKYIEETGIDVDGKTLKGTLVTLCHDNLGGNTALGFVESFRANFFCRICYMKRSDTQYSTEDKQEIHRTFDEYKTTFYEDKNITFSDFNESKGIKNYCILNDLSFFNIFKHSNVDIMHDVLEGAVPFILKHFFCFVVDQLKLLQLEDINNRINSFKYGYMYRKNLPSNICLSKTGSTVGLTAAQNLCLILHFPLIFQDIQKEVPLHWLGVTSLIRIIRIILSPKIPFMYIDDLHKLIKFHLDNIKNTYKKNLIPKHHLMTHYPGLIKRNGPLVHSWAMRYEAKHKYFSKLSSSLNYINICKSLAIRHQQFMAQTLKNLKFEESFNFGKFQKYNITEVAYKNDIFVKENNFLNEETFNTSWVKVNPGYHYRKGSYVCLAKNPVFLFGLIIDILYKSNQIFFVVNKHSCNQFDKNLVCFELSKTEENCIVKYKDLCCKVTFESYSVNMKLYVLVSTIIT